MMMTNGNSAMLGSNNQLPYYNAIVLSPGTYARELYPKNVNESETFWKHEEDANDLAKRLSDTRIHVTSYFNYHKSRRKNIWTNPHRVNTRFFCLASRIILFAPDDAQKEFNYFIQTHLVPLLTTSRETGGRPDWKSRFLVIGSEQTIFPNELLPGCAFLHVIRFRNWTDPIGLIKTHNVIRGKEISLLGWGGGNSHNSDR